MECHFKSLQRKFGAGKWKEKWGTNFRIIEKGKWGMKEERMEGIWGTTTHMSNDTHPHSKSQLSECMEADRTRREIILTNTIAW